MTGWLGYWLRTPRRKWKLLANKVTRTKETEVWYRAKYNRRTHGCDEQRSLRKHMHMNNGQFETLYGRPGVVDKYEYIINRWNNRRTALTWYLQGWNHKAVRAGIASRFHRVVCAKCATGGRWWCFLSSYLSVYGYQDDTEISIRAKTRIERWWNERKKELGDTANLKPDDFLRAKYEHDGRFWTDTLLQIS